MNLGYYIFALLILIIIDVKAQNSKSYDNSFHEIELTDGANVDQFSFISNYLKDISHVGLGEASHGTQEFYIAKSMLIKYLVNNLNFKIIAFEMDEHVAKDLNNFVIGGVADISTTLKNYGLYNSIELKELLEWVKTYNSKQIQDKSKVNIIGFDNKEFWPRPFERDSLMADNLLQKSPKQKCIIWAHNSHLIKSNTWDVTNSNVKAMGNYLSNNLNEKYYFIAFDTKKGSFNVIEDGDLKEYGFEMNKKSLHEELDNFFVGFKNYSLTNIYDLTHINSNWQGPPQTAPSKLGVDFDALIFVNKTSAAKPIE
ncbi:erythromycin esterase family protein [Sphingobacterium olei]|uniref:Erythromycin esterase family protein n=1 Tax=Sphingobacterium olei TaxID=2571155 RepID=A0A4U0NI19_9SPHI|nr:erythromycin esterase family protein [Sphingobacterium olei]TJZ53322.1 erythromycin esterase family protein [Sphingobacterium olei]